MGRNYVREDIEKIIKAQRPAENYYENISFPFVQLEMAIIAKKEINIVSFELNGEVVMAVRQLRQFGREVEHIILREVDKGDPFWELILTMDVSDKVCSFQEFMEKPLNSNAVYLACYNGKIRKDTPPPPRCILDITLFKIKRKIARKCKMVLANPVSKELTPNTINFSMCSIDETRFKYWIYYSLHIEELEHIYDMLGDEDSKNTFVEIIRTHCEQDRFRYKEGLPEDKYFEYYCHLDDEKWVNCGSCFGDTIGWYIYKKYHYKYIDAYEGEKATFKSLVKHIDKINASDVNLYNEFIGFEEDVETNFDARYSGRDVSLINMDIEGAETAVLKGAKRVIAQKAPVLAICAYHKPSDIIEIPRIVFDANKNYSIYIRKYPSSSAKRICEYVYYFVPYGRELKSEEI